MPQCAANSPATATKPKRRGYPHHLASSVGEYGNDILDVICDHIGQRKGVRSEVA